MSLVNAVKQQVAKCDDVEGLLDRDEAIKEAERLADLYSDVRPDPYVIPIERFVGLPIRGESPLD